MSIPIRSQRLPKPDDRRSMTGYGQTRLSSTIRRPNQLYREPGNRRHLHPRPIVSKATTPVQVSDSRQATAAKTTESVHYP
jgi:hypothetical protein